MQVLVLLLLQQHVLDEQENRHDFFLLDSSLYDYVVSSDYF